VSEPTAIGKTLDGGFKAVLDRRREQSERELHEQEAREARELEEHRIWAASPDGRAALDAKAQATAAAHEAERFQTWATAAHEIGIPRRHFWATLRDVKPGDFPVGTDWTAVQASIDRVRLYMARDFPKGRALVLCGLAGTGKTNAVAAALRLLFDRTGCRDRQFWNGSLLRSALMDLDRRRAIETSFLTVPLLVLDDIGLEFSREGDYWEGALDTIFVGREGEMMPLLVTTNLTAEKLKVKLGPRVWDRLRGEWGAVSEIIGPSVRLKDTRPAESGPNPQPEEDR
jgi:DNA replication protein DnaC